MISLVFQTEPAVVIIRVIEKEGTMNQEIFCSVFPTPGSLRYEMGSKACPLSCSVQRY